MPNIEIVTLAALLHDIGTFSQLAGQQLNDIESKDIKKVCPDYGQWSSFLHALHSAAFIEEHINNNQDELLELVTYHHQPDLAPDKIKLAVKIIALADWLSNGEFRGREFGLSDDFRKEPLVSIFSKIILDDKKTDIHYIKPGILDLNLSNLFPLKDEGEKSKLPYSELWNGFTTEFAKIDQTQNFSKYFSTILYLLEKFTCTLPAFSEKGTSYISLFHHLKTTTAIANCLYDLDSEFIEKAYNTLKENNLKENILNETSCYLIGGDVSGIQDFIYSVTSDNALKGLRGRSFYLQLLAESITKSILSTFGLTQANIIFCGGGHFFMLVPKNQNIEHDLTQIKKLVDHNLFEAHRGKLALAISLQELTLKDFFGDGFGKAFFKLKQKLGIEKRKKFSTFFDGRSTVQKIMGPFDVGGTQDVCEICSEELTDEEETEKMEQCFFCQSFGDLSRELVKSKYLIEKESMSQITQISKRPKNYREVLQHFGCDYELAKEKVTSGRTYLINSSKFLNSELFDGFQFFPKYAPLNKYGNTKTLEEFSDEAEGLKTWGVFRADVDFLGKIFKNGLGNEQTITLISTLSYFISLYFSARVEAIAEREFKDKIYIIYSGGDDMFALGPWSVLPDFAKKIYDDFAEFTKHPALTLSGGIYLSPSKKFPVYQAAASAGESLELAKNEGRNNLTYFQQTIPWDNFKQVKEVKDQIVNLLKEDPQNKVKVSKSLIRILYSGWSEKERHEEIQKKDGFSIFRIWRLLYAFKRLKERHKRRANGLTELEENIMLNNELRPYLDVATRWAEYLTR
jgi:CRISPR-associated protein Csm1